MPGKIAAAMRAAIRVASELSAVWFHREMILLCIVVALPLMLLTAGGAAVRWPGSLTPRRSEATAYPAGPHTSEATGRTLYRITGDVREDSAPVIIRLPMREDPSPAPPDVTPAPPEPIAPPEAATARPIPRVDVIATSYRDYMFSRGARGAAITIDDGPSDNTPGLLRVLAEEGARATFFVLGNRVNVYPQYARQIVSEGHEIANHSWSHFHFEDDSHMSEAVWQFQYADQAIRQITGVPKVPLIRIPYGSVYSPVINTLGREGFRFVTWSIDTKDWWYRDAEHTLKACEKAAPGDIILIHSQSTSPETLRAMIRLLRAKGLMCITVSQMMGIEPDDRTTDRE